METGVNAARHFLLHRVDWLVQVLRLAEVVILWECGVRLPLLLMLLVAADALYILRRFIVPAFAPCQEVFWGVDLSSGRDQTAYVVMDGNGNVLEVYRA